MTLRSVSIADDAAAHATATAPPPAPSPSPPAVPAANASADVSFIGIVSLAIRSAAAANAPR